MGSQTVVYDACVLYAGRRVRIADRFVTLCCLCDLM